MNKEIEKQNAVLGYVDQFKDKVKLHEMVEYYEYILVLKAYEIVRERLNEFEAKATLEKP